MDLIGAVIKANVPCNSVIVPAETPDRRVLRIWPMEEYDMPGWIVAAPVWKELKGRFRTGLTMRLEPSITSQLARLARKRRCQ